MSDITMCNGEGCPMKNDCYRFRAEPSEFRQSYFGAPPIKDGRCSFFWRVTPGLIEEKKP